LAAALFAVAFKGDPQIQDLAIAGDGSWDGQLVVLIGGEIEDGAAFSAVEVMVFFPPGIEAPGGTVAFDQVNQADFGKGGEGAIHGVEG